MMISQLIAQLLFACAKSPETPIPEAEVVNPPTPPLEQEPIRKLSPRPNPGPSAQEINAEYSVTAAMIKRFEPGTEISCEQLCKDLYQGSASKRFSEVLSCELTLNTGAEKLSQECAGASCSEAAGTVDCSIKVRRVTRGRLPQSSCFVSPSEDGQACRAQEEALAIFAFSELAESLRRLGAPRSLYSRCQQACLEEREHLALALSMASARTTTSIRVPVPQQSSHFNLTLHNALTGCIDELWAALLESLEALEACSRHPQLARIAEDEVGHAQLSWDVHQWLMQGLSVEQRAKIIEAQHRHLEQLEIRTAFEGLLKTDFVDLLAPQLERAA